jgi:hypothetical protein
MFGWRSPLPAHSHSVDAWTWANLLPRETQLIFCRYIHIGLLRLLTNRGIMGEQTGESAEASEGYGLQRLRERLQT